VRRRRGVGVYGYACLLVWALVAPALLQGPRIYWVPGTVIAASWLTGTRRWRSLGDLRTWLLLAGLALVGAAAGGWGSGRPLQSALELPLRMVARALAVLLAADTFAARVSASELAALGEGAGLAGLGFSLGVAINTLPVLQRTARSTWMALRLRGGPGRRPWRACSRLALTILALSLGRAQEIVEAAEARAFSPGRVSLKRPAWRSGDLGLALGLVLWTVALVLVG
jgi:energy-coupling factor transporter transmembrane protein EcfT